MNKQSILIAFILFISLNLFELEAFMMHQRKIEKEWKEENLPPFNELIISWNAIRPIQGNNLFYVSVKIDDWSPWLLYASWGSEGQTSFLNTEAAHVRIYQDTLEIINEKKATGFQIKIVQEGDAPLNLETAVRDDKVMQDFESESLLIGGEHSQKVKAPPIESDYGSKDCINLSSPTAVSRLNQIRSLHVYTNHDWDPEYEEKISYSTPLHLQVPELSQMTLNHIRHRDLCSPTSTTAVVRYLSKNEAIDPIQFSLNVWDSGFDIFGNWVFNVAQASMELNKEWDCWVERLSGFDKIIHRLNEGTPVIVSVKGPLKESAFPYTEGHLIAVIGYDALEQKVICMDPAFSPPHQTYIRYDLLDFIQAWSRRGKIAYIFNKNS